MTKLLSRLLNLALSVVIGALFKQLWKLTAGEEQAPQAADPKRSGNRSCPPPPFRVHCSQRSRPPCSAAPRKAAASSKARARDRHAPRQAAAAKETAHLVSENVTEDKEVSQTVHNRAHRRASRTMGPGGPAR